MYLDPEKVIALRTTNGRSLSKTMLLTIGSLMLEG